MIKLTINSSSIAQGACKEASVEASFNTNVISFYSISEFEAKFKPYEFNRGDGKLDLARIKKIAKSIAEEGTYWLINPVTINKKNKKILDGHNTFAAIKQVNEIYGIPLKVPVIERIIPKEILHRVACQKFNNSRKSWTLADYIETEINEGNEHYIRLQDMMKNLGEFFYYEAPEKFQWRYASALCGKSQQEELKMGFYTLTEEASAKQFKVGKEIIRIWECAGQPKIGSWMEAFIVAFCKVLENNFDDHSIVDTICDYIKSQKEAQYMFDGNQSSIEWAKRFSYILRGKPWNSFVC